MTRRLLRTGAVVALLASALGAAASPASDLYGNVGPGGSVSGLADRYPLSHYALDQHFSAVKASLTGGIDASGVPAMIAFFLANLLWQITAFCANAVITLFSFAFSLDLLNGSPATGGAGALAPISDAISSLYAHTFGTPWMAIAVTLTGCWAMWHALVQRRYTETAGALGMSLIFCVMALAIVTRPDQTIGQASRLTNQLSIAFLSATAHGELTSGDQARRAAADQLFALLIYRPWVALNFGGTEHCIRDGTGDADHDPEPLPVRPLATSANEDARLRDQLQTAGHVESASKACVENTARYPRHFPAYAPGSDDRDAEYEALNHADSDRLPDSDPTKHTATYQPAVIDKPVTDAMEKGGQDQRLLLALLITVGELGALLLLGSLAVSVVLAQVIVLLLACFAPVALVAAIVPGRGHRAFTSWAGLLAQYVVRKAAYSLVLAIVLAVLSALQDATTNLGWLLSFGLQALLLWTVYLQRHALAGQLTSTLTGDQPHRDAQLRRLLGLRAAQRTITHARRRHPTPTTRTDQPAAIAHQFAERTRPRRPPSRLARRSPSSTMCRRRSLWSTATVKSDGPVASRPNDRPNLAGTATLTARPQTPAAISQPRHDPLTTRAPRDPPSSLLMPCPPNAPTGHRPLPQRTNQRGDRAGDHTQRPPTRATPPNHHPTSQAPRRRRRIAPPTSSVRSTKSWPAIARVYTQPLGTPSLHSGARLTTRLPAPGRSWREQRCSGRRGRGARVP